jgi:hypothetical protein
MNNFLSSRTVRALAGGAALLFATLAQAQYVWVDDKGVKQFSDRPPPTGTPAGKVLKAPGQPYKSRAETAAGVEEMINPKKVEPAPAAKPAASAPDARKGPLTTAEQNAEFKKRQVEKAEADKKAAAAEEQRRVKAENCEIARVHKAQLDSGERISEKDKNGERTFVSDAQRAERQEKARKALEGCN